MGIIAPVGAGGHAGDQPDGCGDEQEGVVVVEFGTSGLEGVGPFVGPASEASPHGGAALAAEVATLGGPHGDEGRTLERDVGVGADVAREQCAGIVGVGPGGAVDRVNLVGGEGDRLDEEILLGGEVAIDGRAGDVDGLADVVDARGRVAVTVEKLDRGFQDQLAPIGRTARRRVGGGGVGRTHGS